MKMEKYMDKQMMRMEQMMENHVQMMMEKRPVDGQEIHGKAKLGLFLQID